jgi:hypothetical protein
MSRLTAPSLAVPAGSARAALTGPAVAGAVLLQLAVPAVSLAQPESADAIRWQGTVKYSETAQSTAGQSVGSVEFRFELITPLRQWPSEGETGEDSWRNVVVTWADSGHWHTPEHVTDGGTVPESYSQWSITDGFAVPSTIEKKNLYPSDVRTNRGDGTVEVELPTLPLYKVGSKVLVQPKGVGLILVAGYDKVTDMFFPGSGQRDRHDRRSDFRVNQRELPAEEVISIDETASQDYAGLPPEIAAQLKMLEAMSADNGDLDDDQIAALAALQMDGFVDFDGGTVAGSRTWTTTAPDPDQQTTVSHEFSWSFVSQKGR